MQFREFAKCHGGIPRMRWEWDGELLIEHATLVFKGGTGWKALLTDVFKVTVENARQIVNSGAILASPDSFVFRSKDRFLRVEVRELDRYRQILVFGIPGATNSHMQMVRRQIYQAKSELLYEERMRRTEQKLLKAAAESKLH